jgi:hypothetical protein
MMVLLGIPAVAFKLLAPSPLAPSVERPLWRLRFWGAALSVFLFVTMAFQERRLWMLRTSEAYRKKVWLDGISEGWRAFAKACGHVFPRVTALSHAAAILAVLGMWIWTGTDPHVTWGQGLEVPVTFLMDTVLLYGVVRWAMNRIGLHLARTLSLGELVERGVATVLRAISLGLVGGWLVGAVFGLSSAFQTAALIPHARLVHVVLALPALYGMSTAVWGVVFSLAMALCLALPYGLRPTLDAR